MSKYYVTSGSVRGDCPHKHRTEGGARECLMDDQAGCRSQGGYSDRSVYEVKEDGTRRLVLEESPFEEDIN